LAYQRAHVTAYMYEHPEIFQLHSVVSEQDHSGHRWTVDTATDLAFVLEVYGYFDGRSDFSWTDVLALVEKRPELTEINRQVAQKAVPEG
jgi:spore coat polysaccharide biosynthesis protein SpsF